MLFLSKLTEVSSPTKNHISGAEANRTMPAVWAGPKASDDTKDGLNALAYAAQQNHYLCVRALLPYIDVERLVRDRVVCIRTIVRFVSAVHFSSIR